MTEVRKFGAALARAGKSRTEIKPSVDADYGDKSLSAGAKARLIASLRPLKRGKPLLICVIPMRWTNGAVASIVAGVEENQRIMVCELSALHGLTFGPVQAILTDDLGLVKKVCPLGSQLFPLIRKKREWNAATPSWTSFGGSRWRS
jgi:hypothetical protein